MPTKDDTRFLEKALEQFRKKLFLIQRGEDDCWLWARDTLRYGTVTANLPLEEGQVSVGYLAIGFQWCTSRTCLYLLN